MGDASQLLSQENPRVDGSWLPVLLLQLHLWHGPAMSLSHLLKTQALCLPALGQDLEWGGGWIASHSCGQGEVC